MTFIQAGDVPLMVADGTLLVGVGKSVLIKTITPGHAATNTELALSFSIPADNGGFAVSAYDVEWATNTVFASKHSLVLDDSILLHQTQVISLYDSAYGVTPIASGTWTLSYSTTSNTNTGGVRTPAMDFDIDARDLRRNLEALPGITAVGVTRDASRIIIATATGTVASASRSVLVMTSSVSSWLNAGDALWIGSAAFRVKSGSAVSTVVSLALFTDATQSATYTGTADVGGLKVYRSGGGYQVRSPSLMPVQQRVITSLSCAAPRM